MKYMKISTLALATALAVSACATHPDTSRNRTYEGAGIGAAVGAVAAILAGKREGDELLAGAAIGAVVGGSVGAYMDRQEAELAQLQGAEVERIDEQTLLVNFDSDILFAVDSSAVNAASRATVNQVAGTLREYDKTAIVLQGHTDSTGSETYNQSLSERRANSVRAELVGLGVDPTRIVAVGYGETQPVADNDTASGRAANRRVSMLLRAKEV